MSLKANAIQIDKMFGIADENGEVLYKITNTDNERVFLNTAVMELTVNKDIVEEKLYTKSNILDWKVEVYPARSIIDPGASKTFKVKYKCENDCKDFAPDSDEAFKIVFSPSPYFEEGKDDGNLMQMTVGFAPVYIYPSKGGEPEFIIGNNNKFIEVFNKGESYLSIKVDFCSELPPTEQEKYKQKCKKNYFVLSNRLFPIYFPDSLDVKKAILKIKSNSSDDYIEKVVTKNAGTEK